MSRFAPLVPAWLVGLWLLVSSEEIWSEDSMQRNVNGDGGASGWAVLLTLFCATLLYAHAASLGRKLLVPSSSSIMAGLDKPNPLQAAAGAGLVRVLVLVGLYLMAWCWVMEFA